MADEQLLEKAKNGDIRAFHTLFAAFQPQLKSYLYRLLTNRNDTEDVAHDVFIIAFENVGKFRGKSSLKTWVFTIATNHAKQFLKKRNRWHTDTFERTRELAHRDANVMQSLEHAHAYAPQGVFDMREHIDYCFTCVSRMLPIEQQIALILKDVYGFKAVEVAAVMDVTLGVAKHLLHDARKTMISIFDDTCALVSKRGVCDQCSGLNGRFNPKEDSRAKLMELKMVKDHAKFNNAELYRLRTKLVQALDPLQARGADLHEVFMAINRRVNADAA